MEKGKGKRCPICNSELTEDVKVCPNCNVEIGIFEDVLRENMDVMKIEGEQIKGSEEIISLVSAAKEEEIIEKVKLIGEKVEEITKPSVEENAKFQCPACGTFVEASATSCPKCSATFAPGAVVAEEQFQCPVCESVVNASATSCPKCSVQFAEEGEKGKTEGKEEKAKPKEKMKSKKER